MDLRGGARFEALLHRSGDVWVVELEPAAGDDLQDGTTFRGVRDAVADLFRDAFPGAAFDCLWMAFHDFRRLFRGQVEGYVGCDTLYHDTQHSLDVTLAMARLLAGYEKSAAPGDQLGPERAVMGLICALFHDAGYIRRVGERYRNGAEFTPIHIARSADFLAGYLPRIGLGELVPVAVEGAGKWEHWARPETLDANSDPVEDIAHILSPFDPLVSQRKRLQLFFGYEHRFEAYVPKQKRQFGYFAQPVLIGDEIVAAIDLKTDREREKLLVQQWTWLGHDARRSRKKLIEQALHRFERFQLAR